MRHRISLVVVLLAAAFFTRSTPAAEKRGITEKDLFDFVWIGDPQVSPDGARVAFVRVSVNEKKLGYDTSIWTVATDGNEQPHRLTNGNHDGSPRWSPDGKFLAFVRATEKDGKPEPPQLAMLPMNGGDAWTFTDLPKGAGGLRWSPDGKAIAFTSSSNPDDLAKQQKKKQKDEEAKKTNAAASPSAAATASPTASP
jgi:dipeptidyl aminopeptidase/acylaminoacyl peptidase